MKWIVATDKGFIGKNGKPQELPSNIMIFDNFGFTQQDYLLRHHTKKKLTARPIKENGKITIDKDKVIINNPGEEETSLVIPKLANQFVGE